MATNKLELAKRHLDALGKSDWTTYRNMMTDDAVYEEEPTRRHVDSADKWVEISKGWHDAFPDLKATMKEGFASGDAVVCEVVWTGTHKGPLVAPMGTIPPTGRSGKVAAVLLMRFDGDRIRECRHYFDLMTVLAQIGVAPQPAQPTA